MNRTTLLVMGGAIIVAIVVAVIVQTKVAPKQALTAASIPTMDILVAVKDMRAGDTVTAKDARWESWPENISFPGLIKRKDQTDETKLDVYGKPLRRDVVVGEPLTKQAVVSDAQGGNFLAASIGPGMRAVGLVVKAETMAGGFIGPGDRVDIILTYQVSLRGDAQNYSDLAVQRFASETILSNVRVLAADQNAKENTREVKVARTVTVEVNKEQAQVLAMASTMGEISLSLRRLGEKDTAQDMQTPLTTDVTTSSVIRRIYEIMDKSKVNAGSVRVYSGANIIDVPVRTTTD